MSSAKKTTKKKTPKATKATAKAPAKAAPAKGASKKAAPKKAAAKKVPGPRADFGAPVDAFFARQAGPLRAVVDLLRGLVEKAVPEATSSLKWGMPVYALAGGTVCAINAHKAHVNLILSGSAETFDDPDGRLEGEGKTGRRLVVRALGDIPRAKVTAWVKAAAAARRGA